MNEQQPRTHGDGGLSRVLRNSVVSPKEAKFATWRAGKQLVDDLSHDDYRVRMDPSGTT